MESNLPFFQFAYNIRYFIHCGVDQKLLKHGIQIAGTHDLASLSVSFRNSFRFRSISRIRTLGAFAHSICDYGFSPKQLGSVASLFDDRSIPSAQ
jgi:hypothetical protein